MTPETVANRKARYLADLANRIKRASPEDLGRFSNLALRDAVFHAIDLQERGVTRHELRAIAKVYAFRLDRLGPEEFDRRTLAESLCASIRNSDGPESAD